MLDTVFAWFKRTIHAIIVQTLGRLTPHPARLTALWIVSWVLGVHGVLATESVDMVPSITYGLLLSNHRWMDLHVLATKHIVPATSRTAALSVLSHLGVLGSLVP